MYSRPIIGIKGARRKFGRTFFILLIIIICLQGCGGNFYGIPKSTWKQMSLDQRIEAIRRHYLNKTIIAFCFLYTPASESYPRLDIYPEGRNYPLIFGSGEMLRLSNAAKTYEMEKKGYYFWVLNPGIYQIKIFPSSPKGSWVEFNYGKYFASYDEPWEFRFEARPGVILDLGLFLFESHKSKFTPSLFGIGGVYEYNFDCTRSPSSLVMRALKETHPEIYGAFEGKIVTK